MIWKLAWRNLAGAKLRTFLNVLVLSISYFCIIALQGLFVGWQKDATREMKNWEIGEGQFWQEDYNPYDPFSWNDAQAPIPKYLQNNTAALPILQIPATIYPEGKFKKAALKGIDQEQKLLALPTENLKANEDVVMIGKRMAENNNLQINDLLTVRWQDKFGAFDAREFRIIHIFSSNVMTIDKNQLWISRKKLEEMTGLQGQATLITLSDPKLAKDIDGWKFRSTSYLLQDLENMVKTKSAGSSVMYVILLFMALVAILDTQILSIFRRRKEIGTMMALGLTRKKIITLFTLEGALHAFLAIFIGAIYGIPLLSYLSRTGINIGTTVEDFGLSGISNRLYPEYGLKLVAGTILLVFIAVVIVSFIPTKKIAKLKPTDALRSKMTK